MEAWFRTIPLSKMRWNMLGDYYPAQGTFTKFHIAETGNFIYDRILAIHELVENTALIAKGIKVETIDAYCEQIHQSGILPNSDNPDSPIHDEHEFATKIEYLVLEYLGIKKEDYERTTDEMYDRKI